MKGIILAGGAGTRLYPLTLVASKQLLPVYDKPMIYYPLSTMMLAGVKELLIISTPQDTPRFQELLGDGKQFGISLSYRVQEKPEGLAQAFIIGKSFIEDKPCAMILGDNIFYGNGLAGTLRKAVRAAENGVATIFGYYVNDPKRFGIVEFDEKRNVISVEEKPLKPKSNYAITGLYFYPKGVSGLAVNIKPSERGELEITSLNEIYLQKRCLNAELLGRGITWIDAGTVDSLIDAANFVKMIEKQQGLQISAPEEIAYRYGWITLEDLNDSAEKYGNSPYGNHLQAVARGAIISAVNSCLS